MEKCMYCNSQNIRTDIEIGQTAEAGVIGLVYRAKFLFCGVEAFYGDLCLDCGNVRLHVKNRERNWRVKGSDK